MPQVKQLILAIRRPDITFKQFDDHWRHPHGTLGCKLPTLRSYVQSHRIDTPHLGDDQKRYDGVAENWYDNLYEAMNIATEPTYLRYVKPDEARFADLERVVPLFTTEDILVSGPNTHKPLSDADAAWDISRVARCVKLLQFVQGGGDKPWISQEDKDLGETIGAFRHVLCKPIPEAHNGRPPYVGVRELCWPTVCAFEEAVSRAPAAFNALISRPASSYTMLSIAERFK